MQSGPTSPDAARSVPASRKYGPAGGDGGPIPAIDIFTITERPLIVDVGGEGRHAAAWNLNPSRERTCGPLRGTPIPRWIAGTADAIPLPDQVVDLIIVERTPLSHEALHELQRVSRPGGRIILRHIRPFDQDPHRVARKILTGQCVERMCQVGRILCQELEITLPGELAEESAAPVAAQSGLTPADLPPGHEPG